MAAQHGAVLAGVFSGALAQTVTALIHVPEPTQGYPAVCRQGVFVVCGDSHAALPAVHCPGSKGWGQAHLKTKGCMLLHWVTSAIGSLGLVSAYCTGVCLLVCELPGV